MYLFAGKIWKVPVAVVHTSPLLFESDACILTFGPCFEVTWHVAWIFSPQMYIGCKKLIVRPDVTAIF